ncbi:MAG: TMEM165/GDT1 family protein [Candidatus Ratteibacteria bacterium]|nr:TMEM165/GDT1 family protein [Candidatus Ratteibacteria bacterium]
MDWKIFLMTFTAVFIAELADKTQLVGIGIAAKTGNPVSVWFGSVAAYMLVTVISVAVGAILAKFIKPEIIRYFGGIVFIVIGILLLTKKI